MFDSLRASLSLNRWLSHCVLLLTVVLGPKGLSQESLAFTRPPTVRPNPIDRAPLVAIVDCETNRDCLLELEIFDGARSWTLKAPGVPTKQHDVAVFGMRPDREHSLTVHAYEANGNKTSVALPFTFRTPALPTDFPPIQKVRAEEASMEPGVTVFAINMWRDSQSIMDYGFIVAMDTSGDVIWYCKTKDRIADMRATHDGNLLYQHGNYRMAYEIDLLGRDLRCWYASNLTKAPHTGAIPVAVDTMHHELLVLPNGNLLTLATHLAELEDYPTSLLDPKAPRERAQVVVDKIVEFNPTSGEVVDEVLLKDLLDQKVFGYLALSQFWKPKYENIASGPVWDWCHANALSYSAKDDSILVSVRHLDSILKINRKSKSTQWILGNPSGWGPAWQPLFLKPSSPVDWFYHQHAPQIVGDNQVLLFDNGNFRAKPYAKPTPASENYSRGVLYEVDESLGTFTQLSEYRGIAEERFYSPFYGEVDLLPQTGNWLITDGGHIELKDGTPTNETPGERQWARIIEVTRDEPSRIVWEVRCQSPIGSRFGWSIYRAQRYSSLEDVFSIRDANEPGRVWPRNPATQAN